MMSLEVELGESDAAKIRRKATDLVARAADSEASFFTVVENEGEHFYSSACVTSGLAGMMAFDGTRTLAGSVADQRRGSDWTVETPPASNLNRFATFAEEFSTFNDVLTTPAHLEAYAPHEITDQARALMYDGDEFLGFIAAMRQGGERFELEQVERLRATTAEVHRLLLLARKLEADENTGALHLIADGTGQILFADERARCWLTQRRMHLIRQGFRADRPFVIDALVARTGWLDNGHLKLRHVALSPVQSPRASRWHHLSKTQRDIVGLALDGLSNREIARLKGISTSTVKYHLNEAARTLDVRGRTGLARALSAGRVHD